MIFLHLFSLKCIFTIIIYSKIISGVPPDYCFHRLNDSDCGEKPRLVFSYYHPGSRCELETWRGCHTYNKFPDQYLCSHTCIYRFRVDSAENKIFKDETPKKKTPGNVALSWKEEINNLSYEETRAMGQLLDEVNEKLITTTSETTKSDETSKSTEQQLTTMTSTDKGVTTILPYVTTSRETTTKQILTEPTTKAVVTKTDPTTTEQFTTTSELPVTTLKVTTERTTQPTEATTESPTTYNDDTPVTDSAVDIATTTMSMDDGLADEVIIARIANFTL